MPPWKGGRRAAYLRYSRSPKARAREEAFRRTEKGKAKARRGRERYRAIVVEAKTRPCSDCGGVFDPVCMDFDHRPDEVKKFNVSDKVKHAMAELLAEIAKCDVVCANCHRLRTYRKRNHRETTNGASVAASQMPLPGVAA